MKHILFFIALFGILSLSQAQETKWQGSSVDFKNGKLKVSANKRFLEFENPGK